MDGMESLDYKPLTAYMVETELDDLWDGEDLEKVKKSLLYPVFLFLLG